MVKPYRKFHSIKAARRYKVVRFLPNLACGYVLIQGWSCGISFPKKDKMVKPYRIFIPSRQHGNYGPIVTRFGVGVCSDTGIFTVKSIDGKKQDGQAIHKIPFRQSGTAIQICVQVCFAAGMVVVE